MIDHNKPDVRFDQVWILIQGSTTLHSSEQDDVAFLQLWNSIRHQVEDDLCLPLPVQERHGAREGEEVTHNVRVALYLPVDLSRRRKYITLARTSNPGYLQ